MFLVILCMADTMHSAADMMRGAANTMRGAANTIHSAADMISFFFGTLPSPPTS